MSDTALPDPRRHAYRGDLAAESLRGLVEAPRFAKGEPRQVSAPFLPLRREPRIEERRPAGCIDRIRVQPAAESGFIRL